MFFQGVMVLASLYFGMLFSNWGFAILDDEDDLDADAYYSNASFSMWVKIAAQWYTIALFIVSVTITMCCDRIL